jgi:hypothetical protein
MGTEHTFTVRFEASMTYEEAYNALHVRLSTWDTHNGVQIVNPNIEWEALTGVQIQELFSPFLSPNGQLSEAQLDIVDRVLTAKYPDAESWVPEFIDDLEEASGVQEIESAMYQLNDDNDVRDILKALQKEG